MKCCVVLCDVMRYYVTSYRGRWVSGGMGWDGMGWDGLKHDVEYFTIAEHQQFSWYNVAYNDTVRMWYDNHITTQHTPSPYESYAYSYASIYAYEYTCTYTDWCDLTHHKIEHRYREQNFTTHITNNTHRNTQKRYCAGHNYTTEPQIKTIFFAEQSPKPDFEAKRRLFSRFWNKNR